MKKLLLIIILLTLFIFGWMYYKYGQNESHTAIPDKPKQSDVIGDVDSHADKPDAIKPETIVRKLTFFDKLSDAAIDRTMQDVTYDPKYVKIAYPMGDVPSNIGVCTDVVIRSYRKLGIDLQQLVHEDMSQHFREYPARKVWGSKKTDTNIDHRRVYNLQTFFERNGESLAITEHAKDYRPGDLVTWQISPKFPHIGIVVDVGTDDPERFMVSHNIGEGPKIDDILFAFPITGHYRYKTNHGLKTDTKVSG